MLWQGCRFGKKFHVKHKQTPFRRGKRVAACSSNGLASFVSRETKPTPRSNLRIFTGGQNCPPPRAAAYPGTPPRPVPTILPPSMVPFARHARGDPNLTRDSLRLSTHRSCSPKPPPCLRTDARHPRHYPAFKADKAHKRRPEPQKKAFESCFTWNKKASRGAFHVKHWRWGQFFSSYRGYQNGWRMVSRETNGLGAKLPYPLGKPSKVSRETALIAPDQRPEAGICMVIRTPSAPSSVRIYASRPVFLNMESVCSSEL